MSPKLELPNLLDTTLGLQSMVELIPTGQQHDKAKFSHQFSQSSSRLMETTQYMSQQADSL
jgi:hypothetical protein